MEGETLVAPCTAIDVLSSSGKIERFYAGVGGEIRAWTSTWEVRKTIFDSHSVHGIKVIKNLNMVVAFGDKAVVLLDLDLTLKTNLARMCDDMVLDCCVIAKMDNTVVNILVGFAHNYVDVLEVLGDQHHFLRRVLAPETCVLFSLQFSSAFIYEGQSLTLASGNVFGKVTLWNFPFNGNATAHADGGGSDSPTRASRKVTLSNHEGVIFRSRWSPDKNYIATVADDRTVRVWNISPAHCQGEDEVQEREVFVGWGHISRVWDVVFVRGQSPHSSVLIASASEDGTVKIWDFINKQCLATFNGHQGDVWRLAAPLEGQFLLSGGNDCSVKLWNVADQILNCPDDEIPSLVSYSFPLLEERGAINGSDAATSTELDSPNKNSKSDSKRRNGTSGLRVSPDGRFIVICLCVGGVWMVDRLRGVGCADATSSPIPSSSLGTWIHLASLHAPVVSTDARFTTDGEGRTNKCLLSCSHPDGSVTFAVYVLDPNNSDTGKVATTEWKQQQQLWHWPAHEQRCTSVHILHTGNSGVADMAEEGHGHGHGQVQTVLLLSASVQGTFALWRVPCVTQDGDNDVDGGHDGLCIPQLLLRGSTRTPRRKGEMVSTACYLHQQIGGRPPRDMLIVGDIKGTVSMFIVGDADGRCEDTVMEPAQSVNRVHGEESISVIATYLSGFLTGGGDGTLKRFFYCSGDKGSYFEDRNNKSTGGDEIFECTGVQSCLPVRIPLEIVAMSNNDKSYFPPSLLVGGFYASKYIVVDVSQSLTRLQVQAGSWRRPHHCFIREDKVHFVSVAPSGTRDCVLKERHCDSVSHLPTVTASSEEKRTLIIPCMPRRVSASHNGRVNYAATFLRQGMFCVGGEEGKIKIYLRSSDGDGDREGRLSSPSGTGGVSVLEEVSLQGNAPVKVLCSAAAPGSRILVGAGSRLCYSIWMFHSTEEQGQGLDRGTTTGINNAEREMSSSKYAACISEMATQEHRILCGKVVYSQQQSCFLAILGDSRGSLSLLLIGDSSGKVTAVPPFQAFSFPVLCCDMVPVGGTTQLCVLGSSSGSIALWALQKRGTGQTGEGEEDAMSFTKIVEYPAHSMGANCVSMKAWKMHSREKTETIGEGAGDCSAERWIIVVCSGGDDQALTLCVCHLTLSHEGSSINCTTPSVLKAAGAAGAALKGLYLRDKVGMDTLHVLPDLDLVTMAADQRVQRWRVKPSAVPLGGDIINIRSPFLQGSPFEWKYGMITFIGDPQCMACDDEEVLITGEGAQTMKLLD